MESALLRLPKEGQAGVDVHVNDIAWRVALRAVPRVTPPAVVVSLSSKERQYLLRFGLPTVAFDRGRRVAYANDGARGLFGSDVVRPGSRFDGGALRELRPLVERLVTVDAPLQPRVVQVEDGRALRVHGLAASNDEPAVLFVEDITEATKHERVMGEFLRNAAHQLRTPLAGIMAAIETLQGGAKEQPADRDRFLAHLETHAVRLSRIARGLLLLARAETGEPLPIDFVELCPLLDDIVDAAEPRDGVAIRAACPPGLAALGTPDLLREALTALVDNAIAHTDHGEVAVTATRSNGDVLVSVSDSGPGIPPEFEDRIFEPFFRVGTTGEGYGLGLAIAAQAVRAMRGEIGVSSRLGEGTTFTVTLRSATVTR